MKPSEFNSNLHLVLYRIIIGLRQCEAVINEFSAQSTDHNWWNRWNCIMLPCLGICDITNHSNIHQNIRSSYFQNCLSLDYQIYSIHIQPLSNSHLVHISIAVEAPHIAKYNLCFAMFTCNWLHGNVLLISPLPGLHIWKNETFCR